MVVHTKSVPAYSTRNWSRLQAPNVKTGAVIQATHENPLLRDVCFHHHCVYLKGTWRPHSLSVRASKTSRGFEDSTDSVGAPTGIALDQYSR